MESETINVLLLFWGRRGAIARCTYELARALKAGGHVMPHLSLSRQSELFEMTEGLGLPGCHVDTYRGSVSALCSLPRIPWESARLARYIRRHHIQAVVCMMSHLWNPIAVPFMKRAGARYFVVIHDPVRHLGEENGFLDWIQRRDVRNADRVITLSRFTCGELFKAYPFVARDSAMVMPMGAFDDGGVVQRPRSMPSKPGRLLFFGRIRDYKGIDLLLDAYVSVRARFPGLRLKIVGEGDLSPYADRLQRAGDGVEVRNQWIMESEIPVLLETADILVLPYREATQSAAVPVALQKGVPCVVTPCGALPEQVQHETTGLVAAAVDAPAVAEAIGRLLEDEALYRSCSENSIRVASSASSWANSAQILEDGVREAIAGKPSTGNRKRSGRMKVMHVITGLGGGGAEGFLVRLLEATRAGHEPLVVSLMDRGRHGDAIEAMGIPVHALGLGRGIPNPLAVWRLVSLIRSEKPDVVVSWMYHANFLTGLVSLFFPGLPLIWTIHHANLDPALNKRRTRGIARWCASLSRRCAAIVYVAERSRELHERMGYRAGGGVVIPIGVDGEAFRPDATQRAECRGEWGVGPDEFVFGLVARLDPLKHHAGFLRAAGYAARENPALRFVLAGEGVDGDSNALMALAIENGLEGRVRFLGHRPDVPAIINGVDVVVLSSLGESFPTVLCEALCCGKPCLSTDVGDAARIVGPHGRIVPPGDDRALASAMVEMARMSKTEREACASGIRERAVGLFDLRRVAAKYKELVETVAGQGMSRTNCGAASSR